MRVFLLVVCLGVFSVMALSNAIVPVLPAFAPGSAWEGATYAAYFLGAFISTLPGGILSDRYGRRPVIHTSLVLTVISGALLYCITGPLMVIVLRLLEGLGAGLFIAAGMSYVNSRKDHTQMSGYYLAMLNTGLVLGLVVSGWLAVHFAQPALGIGVFTVLSLAALGMGLVVHEDSVQTPPPGALPRQPLQGPGQDLHALASLVSSQGRIWYSAIVLVGVTGVVSSLYPEFSGQTPDILGFWIAGMSVATIVAVTVVSRFPVPAVPVIRWSAVFMTGGVLLAYLTPLGFIVLGALAGIVMIAQMAVLAEVQDQQGIVMGLFSTFSYLGMTLLPFMAGLVAAAVGFFDAFLITAILSGTVALSIGWCSRYPQPAR